MSFAPLQPPEIVLDISRLMSRVMFATPTGVDRVEMAYARGLLARIPERLSFGAFRPSGVYCRLEANSVRAFLDRIEAQWRGEIAPPATKLQAIRLLIRLRPRKTPRPTPGRLRIYLQASPHHLDRPELVERILRREQARFACLVHDLIPIEYPEYARPGGATQHRRRMDTVGKYADIVIANSQATADALSRYLGATTRVPQITVAHLGTHCLPVRTQSPPESPYFLCIGTIEPRKNHLLLLHVWRAMTEQQRPGEVLPKLVLVGRRGWENENVIDLLERSPALTDHVIEADRLGDEDVQDLLQYATALLFPTFAEGYGMPLVEALELGVPVIASDLPVLREVGGSVPDYLDPLDGPAWMKAVRDYAMPGSPRRTAQLNRLNTFRAPHWDDHMDTVLGVLDRQAG